MGVDTGLILLAHFITVTLQKIDNSLIAELISIKHINIIIFCSSFTKCHHCTCIAWPCMKTQCIHRLMILAPVIATISQETGYSLWWNPICITKENTNSYIMHQLWCKRPPRVSVIFSFIEGMLGVHVEWLLDSYIYLTSEYHILKIAMGLICIFMTS